MSTASPRPAPAGRDAVVVLASMLVLGVLCGVLWWLLVDPAEFTKTAQGGAMGETDLSKRFGADAWFVVVGLVAGLLAGGGLTAWRSRDPLLTSGLVLLGSLLAAAAASLTGHLLGPGSTDAALRAAANGAKVAEQLDVDVVMAYIGWPIGAMAGALFVLLGKAPEPGPEPSAEPAGRAPYGTAG